MIIDRFEAPFAFDLLSIACLRNKTCADTEVTRTRRKMRSDAKLVLDTALQWPRSDKRFDVLGQEMAGCCGSS